MSISPSVRPLNIAAIKRKAKSFGRAEKIPHLLALNFAAKEFGYENFHHARRSLNLGLNPAKLYSVFLSVYWLDASTKPRTSGLETLELKLPRSLQSFLPKHHCGYARNLNGFFMEFEDHLERRLNADSQVRARQLISRAALTLQFLEATSLQPVTTKRQRKILKKCDDLPSSDHASRWISPATGDWIMLDEPYPHVTKQPILDERCTWVTVNQLAWAKPEWVGLYYPGQTVPHLVSDNSAFVKQIVDIVERLPDELSTEDDQWTGHTHSYSTQFVSPARSHAGKRRRSRPGTTYSYRKNAVELSWRPGCQPTLRPKDPMNVDRHRDLGGILKRLYVSHTPLSAHSKLMGLQSTLEDWMFAENRLAQHKDVDVDVYYGGQHIQPYRNLADQLEAIEQVRSVLVTNYLDCKPLRDQLKALDAAQTAVAKQTSP